MIYARTDTHRHTHAHTSTCTRARARKHTRAHTHTYTHIHTFQQIFNWKFKLILYRRDTDSNKSKIAVDKREKIQRERDYICL